MKKFLTIPSAVLLLSLCSLSQAAVTIEKSSVNYAEIKIKLTGLEAEILSEIAYEDSALEREADAKNDYSTIRSMKCSSGECLIVVEGEMNSKGDIDEAYSKDFNKKLASLKENELYVTAPTTGKGYMGESSDYDGKVTRALLENHTYGKSKAKLTKYNLSNLGKKDTGAIGLFKIEKVIGELKITCRSTLYTDTGIKNAIHDSCSVQAVASLK